MPKFLTYCQISDFYSKQGCTLAVSEEKFKKDVTNNKLPYYCPEGHHITNLTKNNFNGRLNQGLGPCAKCSIKLRKDKRKKRIKDALEKRNCTLISMNKRKLVYKCSCGRECKNWDNNILKKGFTACNYCTNPFNNPKIQEQIRQTIFERYGVTNIMHHKETVTRKLENAFNSFLYTFPSGKQVNVMGYEDKCLDILLETYDEDDIIAESRKIPIIIYTNPEKGLPARYFPDLYIPKENTIIEVKSDWTLKSELNKNMSKFHATIQAGYDLHLYVFNAKKLLYRKIFTKDSVTVQPYPTAQIVFID